MAFVPIKANKYCNRKQLDAKYRTYVKHEWLWFSLPHLSGGAHDGSCPTAAIATSSTALTIREVGDSKTTDGISEELLTCSVAAFTARRLRKLRTVRVIEYTALELNRLRGT